MDEMNNKALVDVRTDKKIGELTDTSRAGLQMVSEASIPTNRVYHFKLPLGVLFKARCVWCMQREGQPQYDAGFQILESDEGARRSVHLMLETLMSLKA